MSRTRGLSITVAFALATTSLTQASVIFVKSGASAGGTGQSWATPHQHLQDALSAAASSGGTVTEIWVAAGVYKPDRDAAHPGGTGSRTATFQLITGVAVRGGFAGSEDPATFELANRDFETNKSILSGDLAGNDGPNFANNSENSYHVVTGSGVGASALLDGFTVCDGNANGSNPHSYGAGMYNSSGNPSVWNCTFVGNKCGYGGGMYNSGSNPLICYCTFTGNTSIYTTGGGIYNTSSSSPTANNCLFSANGGHGFYTNSGSPKLANCTIAGNANGIVQGSGGTAVLTNCIVWGNAGTQISGSLTISYSCIQGGWAGQGNINGDPQLFYGTGARLVLGRESPCIDAGSNPAVPPSITQDLNRDPRFIDNPDTPDTGNPGDPPVAIVDMGAYEYQTPPSGPDRLYVSSTAAPGGDGTSWTLAYRFLQDALESAQVRGGVSEIWVARGTYLPDRNASHPDGTGLRSASFRLPNHAKLFGGFPEEPGQENDLSLRDPFTYPSILSGDLAGNDGANFTNIDDNTYHVVTGSTSTNTGVLDGFTVSGGNANGSSPDNSGAGVYSAAPLSLTNCVFTANKTSNSGGGVYHSSGSAVLTNCRFQGNSGSVGGGIYSTLSNPVLVNCSFTNNSASGSGGAVYGTTGALTLTNCTISLNSADPSNRCGGIYLYNATATVTNCILWGNDVPLNGSATVTYSCIQRGWAGEGNIDADPKLLFAAGGNIKLRHGSPCIDAGDNTVWPAGAATDLLGSPRFVDDGETPDTGRPGIPPQVSIDMGACEYQQVAARRLYVNNSASPGGNGQNWTTAYRELQDALGMAQSDSAVTEIWVAGGVYRPDRDASHPNGSGDRAAAFKLLGGIGIYGGFPGEAGQENDLTVRDWAAHKTVLSGDLAGNDVPDFTNSGENSYHVLMSTGIGPATTLDGFVISGGNANGSSSLLYCGGGMYNAASSPVLANCTFTENRAVSPSHDGNGGAVYNSASDPLLINCTLSRNNAGLNGGGMYNDRSSPVLNACAFIENSAMSYGGGMYNSGGNPKLINCRFLANLATDTTYGQGGAMANSSANPILINCTLSGNLVLTANTGSIYGFQSSPTLTNCILWGNSGLPFVLTYGTATVTYSCIQGGWSGTGNLSVDPLLLADGRLRRGSPCIDAANNVGVPAGITTDVAGSARFVDDTDTVDTGNAGTPPTAVVDMGAYEYQPAAAKRLYAKSGAASGGDGQSWSTAFACLQDALAAQDPAVTEIWVAGGVYRPDRDAAHPAGSRDRRATFQLLGGQSVYGGFPGLPGQEGDSSVRDPLRYVTVLSGDLAGDDGANFANNAENAYHVLTANGVGPTAVLDGFTISGGHADGSGPRDGLGGALYVDNSASPILRNCCFESNVAYTNGAAVYQRNGNPIYSDCVFRGNSAQSGGGLYIAGGSPQLNSCTFEKNAVQAGGGGISSLGNPTLINCTFIGNYATSYGGGFSSSGGNITLTGCKFVRNITQNSGRGGGLCNSGGMAILTNCVFVENVVGEYGAGGGMHNSNSSPTLTNCTFLWNSAEAYASNAGGLYTCNGSPILTNCIIWGNTFSQVVAQCSGAPVISYSCIQGGATGTGNINADPMLLPDGRLHRGSPCIDAGNNASVPAGIITDIAGNARFCDDPGTPDTGNPGNPPNAVVDIGAYEYQPMAAKRLYVNSGAMPGGDGTNWATAYRTLQEGLAAVDPGVTEIWVAAGVYKPDRDAVHPNGNGDRTAVFQLLGGLAILGGFPGQPGQEGNLAVRNPAVFATILSGDLAGNDGPSFANDAENSYHVLKARGVGPTAVLDGFTISGGNASSTPPNNSGGGMYVYAGGPTVKQCAFVGNRAPGGGTGGISYSGLGGGIYSSAANLILSDCTFSGNSALDGGDGGGLYTSGGNLVLTRCAFSGCLGHTGGGLYSASGNLQLTSCRYSGNWSLVGGGLRSAAGDLVLANCVFVGNTASNSSASSGGGLHTAGGSLNMVNCTLLRNYSSPGTGGVRIESGTASLSNCILYGNSVSQISGTATVTYSCVQGGWSGTGNLSVDPRLLPNGGLRRGSPCIDAGNNAAVPSAVAMDIVGTPRFVNDPDTPDKGNPGSPARPVVDMGAYEYWPVPAKRLYVRAGASPGGNGANWSTPYQFLQDALLSNDAGVVEVWVAGGVYKPDCDSAHPGGNRDRTAAFQLPGGVPVYGGFPGQPGQEGQISFRNPGVYRCTLSGDLAGDDGLSFANNAENSYHVVSVYGGDSGTILDGFTISGGNANGSSPNNLGAALYNSGGTPVLANCKLTANASYVLYCSGGGSTLRNCAFLGNSGTNLYATNSAMTLVNCTSVGGALQVTGGSLTMTNSIVQGILSAPGSAVTYSCVQGGWSGTGNLNADPRLLPNGSLRRGSACIDAGNNAAVPTAITTDLVGSPRLVDDPDTSDKGNPGSPARPVVDIGACEYQPVPAKRLYVGADAAPGGNGANWTTPYQFLQHALLSNDPGVVEVWVAGGVYKPDSDSAHPGGSRDRAATFQLPGGVATLGGFPGEPGQEGDLSVRKPATFVTILSGDLTGNDGPNFANNGENSYHVVSVTGGDSATILDGFTISGGNANSGVSPNNGGGGVYNSWSNAVLTACSLISNSGISGGAIYNSYSNPTLLNCVFRANSASTAGGAVYNSGSRPTLTNCTFNANSASSGSVVFGDSSSRATLTNCILWSNPTSQIYGTATVTYSCIQGGRTGIGNISSNPLLVDAAGGNLHLSAGSPCIDAGTNEALPASVTTDLDGYPRFADDLNTPDCGTVPDTCGEAPIVDMGAYEFWPTPTADLDHDGVVSPGDFDRFLMTFGRSSGASLYNPEADFDRDSTVTLVDYQLWLQQYRAAVGNPQAPAPLEVLGDFQRDGHVDTFDLEHVESCQTGPSIPSTEPICRDADLDGDSDIDQDDFGLIQRCFTDSGIVNLACKH